MNDPLAHRIFMTNREAQMRKYSDFCDLSDAMKIWAIGDSNYFACNFSRPKFGMQYVYSYYGKSGAKGMLALYKNEAEGVCQVYAEYEVLLFQQLGIPCYFNSNHNINHAWSVVKVRNSSNKVLWIPFDYGIGPAERLSVSDEIREKYLKTEKMRYKLYLEGIKDAPKKKNFEESDFN